MARAKACRWRCVRPFRYPQLIHRKAELYTIWGKVMHICSNIWSAGGLSKRLRCAILVPTELLYLDLASPVPSLQMNRSWDDGSNRVASLWDRTLSCRGTHNRISMEHMLSLDLTAPRGVLADARGKRVYIQSYKALLAALTKISGQRYLNSDLSNSVLFCCLICSYG